MVCNIPLTKQQNTVILLRPKDLLLKDIDTTLYIIKLLGRVYHFSSLICYPCSFYLYALMLVVF